jgi:hypothetical protein
MAISRWSRGASWAKASRSAAWRSAASSSCSAGRAGNAADGVQELALDECPALDLQAQRHEEGGHGVEICDREADVIEASYR